MKGLVSSMQRSGKFFSARRTLNLILGAFAVSLILVSIALTSNLAHQTICFSVNSSASGISQLFSAEDQTGFREENSSSVALQSGTQELCFPVALTSRYLRWDPSDKPGSIELTQAMLLTPMWQHKLPFKTFGLINIEPKELSGSESVYTLSFNNSDPQLVFKISYWLVLKEVVCSTLIFTLLILPFLYALTFAFTRVIVDNNRTYQIVVCTALMLLCVWQIIGLIPVGDGSGWDGGAYLNLIFDWRNSGSMPTSDPYRMSRLPGFSPLVVMEFLLHLDRKSLITAQVCLNVIGFSAAMGLFYNYLRRVGKSTNEATQYSVILMLTWPIIALSTFYPLLSDHLAIIFSCIILWLHSKKYLAGLWLACLTAPLIMPGIFLLPVTLLAFSRQQTESLTSIETQASKSVRVSIFIVLAILLFVFAYYSMSPIANDELLHRGSSLAPGMPEYRMFSTAYIALAFLGTSWLWSGLFSNREIYRNISPKWLTLGVVAAAAGHATLYFGLDWNNGFKGPDLLKNMFYQALNTPFKPLLAHFMYFGPIFIVALVLLFNHSAARERVDPVAVVTLGFLPILLIGSESRQWAALLPFLAAYVAKRGVSTYIRMLMIAYSVLLTAPLLWLADSSFKAYTTQLPMVDPHWQIYFGRQGPWMSFQTYKIAALLVTVFIGLWLLVRRLPERQKPSPHN